MDVVELVQSQDVDVVDDSGEVVSDAFLEAIEALRKKSPEAQMGISWRWVLGQPVEEEEGVYLMTQMLPCSIGFIEKNPSLREDHSLGVMVLKTPVSFNSFVGDTAPGPVPTFFSSDPEASRKQLKESPEYAFQCMQRLVSRLLARREITRY